MGDTQITDDISGLDKLVNMVENLEFNQKMELLRRVFGQQRYREEFYRYTERLAEKYGIKPMNAEELNEFLHAE